MRWFHPWTPLQPLRWPHGALIPLLNVLWLLVGWMLLGPAFTTASAVPLQLPNAVTAEAVGGDALVITVTARSLLYLNNQLTTLDELRATLAPLLRQGRTTILIRADANAPIGPLASLWDLCRQLGAARVAVATTPPLPE
ncbi:MAG: biopolymer transporter ExbD [Candidatus Omnitrophica bacterium]|nr:biopolymer transporter ExbD [Candidatus Omnitrophota bacterium]